MYRMEKDKVYAEAKMAAKLDKFKMEMDVKLDKFKQEIANQFKQEIGDQIKQEIVEMEKTNGYMDEMIDLLMEQINKNNEFQTNGRLLLPITRFSTEFAKGDGQKDARYSATFDIGGFFWRIMAYTYTKKCTATTGFFSSSSSSKQTLAFFLICVGNLKNEVDWCCLASATLRVKAQKAGQADKLLNIRSHTFAPKAYSWGWSEFITLPEILDPTKGWIDSQDTVTLVADVSVEAAGSRVGVAVRSSGQQQQ